MSEDENQPGMSFTELAELKGNIDSCLNLTQNHQEQATKLVQKYQYELAQLRQLQQSILPMWELCEKQLQVGIGLFSTNKPEC